MATPRSQRKQILRDLEQDHGRKERGKLRSLRGALTEARQNRREAIIHVKALCRLSFARYKRSAKVRRDALERELAAERDAAQAQCRSATDRATRRGDAGITAARGALSAEKLEQRTRKIWVEPRRQRDARSRAERRAESDDEVAHNIERELVPIWQKLRHRIRGSERRSRTEAFLEYVHDHSAEIAELREKLIEAEIERLVAEQPHPDAYDFAEYSADRDVGLDDDDDSEVPF